MHSNSVFRAQNLVQMHCPLAVAKPSPNKCKILIACLLVASAPLAAQTQMVATFYSSCTHFTRACDSLPRPIRHRPRSRPARRVQDPQHPQLSLSPRSCHSIFCLLSAASTKRSRSLLRESAVSSSLLNLRPTLSLRRSSPP